MGIQRDVGIAETNAVAVSGSQWTGMDFALLADEFDKLLTDARIQYLKEDYSALPRSVQYRMLWLAYKSANCNGIHYPECVNLNAN